MFMNFHFRIIVPFFVDTLYNLKGQDGKVKNKVEDVSLSVEVPSVRDTFGSTNTDPSLNSDDHNCMHIESPANSLLEETESNTLSSLNENVNNIVDGISLLTDVSVMENPSSGSCTSADIKSDDYIMQPTESSSNSSLEEKVSPNIKGQDEEGSNITETVSSSGNESFMENYSSSSNFSSSLNFDEHGKTSLESSATASLEEKIEKFIQNGDLDMLEGKLFIAVVKNLSII